MRKLLFKYFRYKYEEDRLTNYLQLL